MLTGLCLVWGLTVVWAAQGYDVNDQWNRMAWGWAGLAGLVTLALASHGEWAKAALLGWVTWTMMSTTPLTGKMPRSLAWRQTGQTAVLLAAGYALWPVGLDMGAALIGLVVVGLGTAAWAAYTRGHEIGQYQHAVGWWMWYDESRVCPRAGQGNANHAQAVVVLGWAAMLSLAVTQSPWWLVTAPGLLTGIGLCRDHRGHWLTQGVVQAGLLGLVAGGWAGWR